MNVNDWDGLLHGKETFTDDGQKAELIEFVGRDRDSWGEAYEGDSTCYLYFQVGDKFYRKRGSESSYGPEIYWEYGDVVEVFPKTVTTTVYNTTWSE